MGMFDCIKCSAPIGALADVECQTKDIDSLDGGTMSFYWVDPNGCMWTTDYSGCTSVAFFKDDADDISTSWDRLEYRSTGVRGKVYRVYITGRILMYNIMTHPDGLHDTTECYLDFEDGILKNYRYINNFIEK